MLMVFSSEYQVSQVFQCCKILNRKKGPYIALYTATRIIYIYMLKNNNIGRTFLSLINLHFPKGNTLHKFLNPNNIKVSYSCSRNMTSIVTATTSRSAILAPETWPALSQPLYQGQLLLLQKHDQHCHSHNIKSATLAQETWPALSQPQHQGQLLLLQKHDQHSHSHNIKFS